MIIIPIDVEQGTVRRLPWVTFGIMIACAIAFVPTNLTPAVSERDVAAQFKQVIDYYFEHPYLELPDEIHEVVFGGVRQRDREALQEVLKESLKGAKEQGVDRAAEQRQLDELCDKAIAMRDALPLRRYGLTPAHWSPLTLVTHMFLHAGWLHLLGNMLMLYLSGPFIEDRFGRPLFAGLYFGSGLIASALHMAAFPHSEVPMVGASGAIAGVMGAFLIRFARMKVRFFYLVGLWARGTFWAPAWSMLALWIGQQFFMASLTSSLETGGDGVAYWAHIGGFAAGAGAALLIKIQRIEERFLHPALERKTETEVLANETLEEALAAQASGDIERAWNLLRRHTLRNPRDRDAALALWQIALDTDRVPQAVPALLRAIDGAMRAGEADVACAQWTELVEMVPEPPADAAFLIRIAHILATHQTGGPARRALEQALAHAPGELTPAMAVRAARIARELDPALAERAARLALELPGGTPADADCARELLDELARERELAPVE